MNKIFIAVLFIILFILFAFLFFWFKYPEYFSLSKFNYEKIHNLVGTEEGTEIDYKCLGFKHALIAPGATTKYSCFGIRYDKRCFYIKYEPARYDFLKILEKKEISCN